MKAAKAVHKHALAIQCDVTDPASVRAAFDKVVEAFGGVDIVVSNAGAAWQGNIGSVDDEVLRKSFELNFFAVVDVLRAVLPGMRARGGGWIVNMSSVAGLRGVPAFGYYSAAKAACEAVTSLLPKKKDSTT